MIYTIKDNNPQFNLLYLDYQEFIINSQKCFLFRNATKQMEKGMIHLNSRSIIFEPKNIHNPIIRFVFKEKNKENNSIRTYRMDEITSFYNNPHNDAWSKEKGLHSYMKKRNTASIPKELISNILNNPVNSSINNTNSLQQIPEEKTISTKVLPKKKNFSFGNTFFSINVNNFIEIIEKVIQENNEINQNLFFCELINKYKKGEKLNSIHSHFAEIASFFNDNGLNFQNFCELLNVYIQNIDKPRTNFFFILIKSQRNIQIGRDKITNYNLVNQHQSFMLIVEAENSEISNFLEEFKLLNDNNSKETNEFLSNLSNKKIERLLNKLEDSQKIKQNKLDNINLQSTSTNNVIQKSNNQTIPSNSVNIITKLTDSNKAQNEFNYIKRYKVNRILPEGVQIGLLIINKNNLVEFHPVINNYKHKALSFKLSDVNGIIRFRYLYTFKSVNIFLYNRTRSKIFDFEDKELCNDFFDYLKENAKNIDKDFDDIKYKTNLWIDGFISNFDYLMFLNTMSCRSFSDLSQYPIMPWVLNNYDDKNELDLTDENNYRDLSKPIGTLNPQRLAILKDKYNDMKVMNLQIPHLYGSHYSNPSITIYYLTRSLPYYKLMLESGNFGPADRVFKCMKDTWNLTLNRTDDFKELIPEFYDINNSGNFLVNSNNLQFGKTQNGDIINHVSLPKWANTPSSFVRTLRAALESDIVSSKINEWIDLIFGYKQIGEESIKSDNVFFPTAYDSLINLNVLKEEDLAHTLLFITEFGQTPKQLFFSPHPHRKVRNVLLNKLYGKFFSKNPQEDTILKINNLMKENEKLEKEIDKIKRGKEKEKEELNKYYEEVDNKRKEKIKILKDSLKNKEKDFKDIIDNLIEQNTILKQNFETYDKNKDEFYIELIENMKNTHQHDIDNKFSNKLQLFKYIENLETSLNKYKIKDLNYEENYDELKTSYDKLEQTNKNLKEQLKNFNKKLKNIPSDKK